MNMNETFRIYAELKVKEKSIKEEIETLAPQIMEYLIGQDIEKQPTTLGVFSIAKRKSWKYTNAVEIAEKKFKDLQIKEQADGSATFTEKPYLLFITPKEQNDV